MFENHLAHAKAMLGSGSLARLQVEGHDLRRLTNWARYPSEMMSETLLWHINTPGWSARTESEREAALAAFAELSTATDRIRQEASLPAPSYHLQGRGELRILVDACQRARWVALKAPANIPPQLAADFTAGALRALIALEPFLKGVSMAGPEQAAANLSLSTGLQALESLLSEASVR